MSVEWVTTGTTTKHGEPRGWRLHAVEATSKSKFSEIAHKPAACGLRAPWGLDLFIEKKCIRCMRRLGLACPACRGTGVTKRATGGRQTCETCLGKGDKRTAPV